MTPRGLAEAQKRPGDARFLAPSQDAPPIQEVYITGLTRHLDLLRHLDRARAVGLLGVARRAGPEAWQALDAGH